MYNIRESVGVVRVWRKMLVRDATESVLLFFLLSFGKDAARSDNEAIFLFFLRTRQYYRSRYICCSALLHVAHVLRTCADRAVTNTYVNGEFSLESSPFCKVGMQSNTASRSRIRHSFVVML